MLLAQLVEDVDRVEAGVVSQLARNHFQRLGVSRNQQLLLACDRLRVLAQVLAELHLRRK